MARPRAPLSRRQARRQALVLLYQWDLTGQEFGTLYDGAIDDHARQLAEAVREKAPALDERITAAAEGWTADRLGTVERNVLRLAIHEIESKAVPFEIAVNEAVVLAKRYANDTAGRLVNGILGRIGREQRVREREAL